MLLMHTVASGLPRPGYNNSRPHCLSLTLPGGEGWFFQAGTEDLVAEWVQTCNYWAARISRQPLQGGVSNMEYGWSRAFDSTADDDDKASVKSSRSSLSKFTGTYGRRGVPADKIHINDWRPPPPAMMPSPLDEENQLEALASYVRRLETEHEQHQAIEEPMSRLVSLCSLCDLLLMGSTRQGQRTFKRLARIGKPSRITSTPKSTSIKPT
jgi:PH/SEC7 domain-containing protein